MGETHIAKFWCIQKVSAWNSLKNFNLCQLCLRGPVGLNQLGILFWTVGGFYELKVTYDFLFHNMNFIDVFKDKKVVIVWN